jgi:23S rRNA pseudouridine1911/1915/1917 synthase
LNTVVPMAEAPIVFLYADEFLCVAHKPAGMPVQPDPTGDPDLLTVLCRQLTEPALGLVHRLDRPVSGAVLFAHDAPTLAALNTLFRERGIDKCYWAIVEGRMEGEQLLEHHLTHDGKAKRARVAKEVEASDEAARLHVKPLAAGDRYTLLELRPEGGAFHQIRAQLAAAGHPIKGDVKYGARRGERDRSIALHARSLTFHHPATDRLIAVEAPPPEDPLWKALRALMR